MSVVCLPSVLPFGYRCRSTIGLFGEGGDVTDAPHEYMRWSHDVLSHQSRDPAQAPTHIFLHRSYETSSLA
jgi:hypothetical protein